ncbi:MAG: glycosyltransferase family 2 protein, partial [Marinicellaceae bacterium]
MTSLVNILLPVHNRRQITERFIQCLEVQSYLNYRLILIDDGSIDGTDQMVKSRIGNSEIIKGDGDWWWAGSLQKGIDWLEQRQVSDTEIVMFANDDVT